MRIARVGALGFIGEVFKPAAIVLAVILAAAGFQPAHAAAPVVVDTGADDNTVNGNCTLREAISAIATATTVDSCAYTTGADTITFAGNYTITLNSGLGSLIINGATVTITGNGEASTIIQGSVVSGLATYRLVSISGGANVTLSNLTVRNGGGITAQSSTLALSHVTVAGNVTNLGGGVSSVGGVTTLDHSTISGNTAGILGGGVFSNLDASFTITASTISGNTTAQTGGGVYFNDGGVGNLMTITSSTISGNTAGNSGGGLYAVGPVTITASRLLNNSAGTDGGAVLTQHLSGFTTTIHGSCIVGNSPAAISNPNTDVQDNTGNWWGSVNGPGSVGPSSHGDTVSTGVDFSGFLTAPILGCPILANELPPPTLKSPKDGVVVYKPPKLAWAGSRNALGFRVEVDDDADFSSPAQIADVLKPPLAVSSLPFGVYYWHVATRDWFGPGVYSAALSFEVTLNKTPKKNAVLKTGLAKFAWLAVKGKTYLLRVNDETAHTVTYQTPSPLNKPTFTVDKASPLPSGSYSWQVSIDGGASWTPAWAFSVN